MINYSNTFWGFVYFFMFCVPGSRVVPAGLLYPASQDANVIGHHVVKRLELLLDSLQLHCLCLSLSGPVDKKT